VTPLSVVRIYRESLRLWGAQFLSLTILSLALEAPIVVVELVLHLGAGLTIRTDAALVSAATFPIALYGSLSHHFLSGLLERMVGAERAGHPEPTLGEVLHDLPWKRLVGADLAYTGLVVAGFFVLIVPGILIATWLTPLLVIVNMERDTVRRSIVRSYRLVKGHFWRVFLVGFVALVLVDASASLATALVHAVTDSHLAAELGNALPIALLMPIGALPIVVVTFDLVALDADKAAREPA
jgi:hypothetical protein